MYNSLGLLTVNSEIIQILEEITNMWNLIIVISGKSAYRYIYIRYLNASYYCDHYPVTLLKLIKTSK